jgi:hypothetical protein
LAISYWTHNVVVLMPPIVAVVMVGPTVRMRDRSEHWGGEVRLAK